MTIETSVFYLSQRDCAEYNGPDESWNEGPAFHPGWYFQDWQTGEPVGPFSDEKTAVHREIYAQRDWAAGMVGGMLS